MCEAMKGFLCLLLLGLSVSSLELTGSSTNVARLGSDARVPCLFTVDKPPVDPSHVTIFWHFLEKEILSYNKTVRTNSSRYSLSTEELLTGAANLTISDIRISDGGRYKCSVIYNSERREKRLWLDVGVPPQVTITDKTVVVNEESVLRCSATGFYPIDIEVKWFRGSERLSDVIVDQPQKNPDRTYSVNSTVTITPTEEDREQNFSCRVRHFHLTDPRQVDFQLIYEDRSSAWIMAVCFVPVVILIIIITGVLWWKLKPRKKAPLIMCDIVGPPKLIDGEEAALHCTVDNTPEDLCVTWLIRRAGQEQEIQTSKMRERSEEEESLLDTSYVIKSKVVGHQYSSSLSFIPHMERHKGVTFICRGVSGKRKGERTFSCEKIYVKPKMSQPIMRSLSDCGEMKYLLNLEKFYPKSIKIVWTCGEGRTQKVILSTDSISENIDRSYSVSSEIVIPEDQHKDPGFRVRVTWEHESMEKPESRELNIRDSDYSWTPVVEEIQIPRLLLGSPAVLQCNISEYFPDAVTVKWKRRNGHQLHEETDDNQRITSRRAADNTYSRTASLTITPNLQTHQGSEYICLVEHPSLETPIKRRTGPLQVYGKPQMSAPIEITMAGLSRVQFSLKLQEFYPKDIKISWRSENKSDKYVISAVEPFSAQDEDLTYEVTSVAWIFKYSFRDPEMEIIVEWNHESMETSERRSLSVRDFPWRPHVESINVPELEDGKEATLTCDISGYFPNLLSVIWLTKKDGNVTELPRTSYVDKTYKISYNEKRQKDNTYSYEASLTFTPLISSHQGSEILCRVQHPSEERPIEQSTGPLHIDVKKQNSGQSAKQIIGSGIQNTIQFLGNLSTRKEKALTPGSKNNEVDETGQETTEDAGAEPQWENPDS